MWWKWLPWRLVISRVARSHGFIDPMRLLSRLSRFAQPAEVTEPIELMRAGVVFHARGLINSRAIQHNLDWVWPYWVQRQFDPDDPAFVPRAFSLTHVNLTHRNWTAIGQPGCDWLPIVDPAGLVTPFYDGWSLDAWVVPADGEPLYPACAQTIEQRLEDHDTLAVTTEIGDGPGRPRLTQRAEVMWLDRGPCLELRLTAEPGEQAKQGGWLVVSARPANPEGVSFIHDIEATDESTLRINDEATVRFDRAPAQLAMSNYAHSDVAQQLTAPRAAQAIRCHAGLATGAAMFELDANEPTSLTVRVPLREGPRREPGVQQMRSRAGGSSPQPWTKALEGTCQAQLPDARMQRFYDAAVRSLILHCPGAVYPGPYTYRRFWFRDAAMILETMLALGRFGQARSAIEQFPAHQTKRGYFRSQQGEWDANGEVLWLLGRYRQLSGMPLSAHLTEAMQRGARWLWRKRTSDDVAAPHGGLLPAGFSAEHLGPIDFYLWDDFWAVAGLDAAEVLCRERDQHNWARRCRDEAQQYRAAIDRAIAQSPAYQRDRAMPASPYRRMDAGAIGSIAAGYPLQLFEPDDLRLLNTVNWLLDHCTVRGGFFQDMIHSGVNPYLTLHLAQVLLRAGDDRYFDLMQATAVLASPTGQWPEAVHPRTGGGCMGDGQHIWAAAEWVRMVQRCFAREEGGRLILASGIAPAWLAQGQTMQLGPLATPYGTITVTIVPEAESTVVRWQADWRQTPGSLEVHLPGHAAQIVDPAEDSVRLNPAAAPAAATHR
jgi:hypothetical protein